MRSPLFLIFFLLSFFALPAFAETPSSTNDSVSVDSTSAVETETVDVADFSDEGLGDEDLSLDLEAEALPTTNNFIYRWERLRDNIKSIFTFNAEKKAALYRSRLHQLDRKMAACAEIGDEQCTSKVEEHIQALEDRADSYIERRQELQEKLLDRFDQWRANRDTRIEGLKQRAIERRAKKQELKEQREEKRAEAKKNRLERRKEAQENKQERQTTIQQRQQNREQLIEMRSSNLKNQLDATLDQVEQYNQETEEVITEY